MHDMMKRYYRARGVRVPDNDNTTPAMQRVVEAQAAFYGLTVPQHRRAIDAACALQECAEFNQWEA